MEIKFLIPFIHSFLHFVMEHMVHIDIEFILKNMTSIETCILKIDCNLINIFLTNLWPNSANKLSSYFKKLFHIKNISV